MNKKESMKEKTKVDKTELAWAWYVLERILNIKEAIKEEVRRETAEAIFEDIEFNKGKGRDFIPETESFVIKLKDWKKLKEKWLK